MRISTKILLFYILIGCILLYKPCANLIANYDKLTKMKSQNESLKKLNTTLNDEINANSVLKACSNNYTVATSISKIEGTSITSIKAITVINDAEQVCAETANCSDVRFFSKDITSVEYTLKILNRKQAIKGLANTTLPIQEITFNSDTIIIKVSSTFDASSNSLDGSIGGK